MMQTRYKRGVYCERKAMEVLEQAGYHAMRTAGSHGKFDVIGLSPLGARFLQIKRSKDGYYNSTLELVREELQSLPHPPGVTLEVWVWQDKRGWVVQEVV